MRGFVSRKSGACTTLPTPRPTAGTPRALVPARASRPRFLGLLRPENGRVFLSAERWFAAVRRAKGGLSPCAPSARLRRCNSRARTSSPGLQGAGAEGRAFASLGLDQVRAEISLAWFLKRSGSRGSRGAAVSASTSPAPAPICRCAAARSTPSFQPNRPAAAAQPRRDRLRHRTRQNLAWSVRLDAQHDRHRRARQRGWKSPARAEDRADRLPAAFDLQALAPATSAPSLFVNTAEFRQGASAR